MKMTSNCDVTNSDTPYDPEPKPSRETFLRTPLCVACFFYCFFILLWVNELSSE